MKNKRIFICGGHFAPALAVIEELSKKNHQLFYLGRKSALEGDKAKSLEFLSLKEKDVVFLPLTTGRLQRSITVHTLLSFLKIPLGFFQSIFYFFKYKPNLVLSFGGYVSLPVCVIAGLFNIPFVVHEQTSIFGLTNRIVGKSAKVVLLTWEKTKKVPKGVKTKVVGLPLRRQLFEKRSTKLVKFGDKKMPLLYITGGSLGARSMNMRLSSFVPKLLQKYRVFHQCGSADDNKDYKILEKMRRDLPEKLSKNYKVVKFVDPNEVGAVLKACFLAVSRSGANTVMEIAKLHIPAIFIPLPWAADNEQMENARKLEKVGLAKIIAQENLNEESFFHTLKYFIEEKTTIKNAKQKLDKNFPKNSAYAISEITDKIMNS